MEDPHCTNYNVKLPEFKFIIIAKSISEKDKRTDMATFEDIDWREIDPAIHGWEEGLSAFIATHQELIARLHTLDDRFLDDKVDFRNYNFRFLLNGLIQHNIYHLGQIAYLNKLL